MEGLADLLFHFVENGVPYGLTHEEWDEINSETETEKTDNEKAMPVSGNDNAKNIL